MEFLGKVLSINEVDNINDKDKDYTGYKIITDNNTFLILIENNRLCCEDYGYFSSDDNIESYIGKTLINFRVTDTLLNSEKFDIEFKEANVELEDIQFIDFIFSDGTILQFAVYNHHNGYYGHSILFKQNKNCILESSI